MGVKSLILLGLITSGLFTYFCINSKKDSFYAMANQTPQPATKPINSIPIQKPALVVATKLPSFAYIDDKKSRVAAILSSKDKDTGILKAIEDLCGDGCVKDIKYNDRVKTLEYKDEILAIINSSIEHKIKSFSLYMDKKEIKVDGVIKNQKDVDDIKEQLKAFEKDGYKVSNNIHKKIDIPDLNKKSKLIKKEEPKDSLIIKKEVIQNEATVQILKPKKVQTIQNDTKKSIPAPVVKSSPPKPKHKKVKKKVIPVSEVIVNEAVIAPKDVFVIPKHITIQEARERINDLLYDEPINFEVDDTTITPESKITLNKIADILLGQDNIKVEVAGYTDASGDVTYNKVLSQKRADRVRAYLIKQGVRKSIIRSRGYGATNFISQPEDMINRRVEIHIKEGR